MSASFIHAIYRTEADSQIRIMSTCPECGDTKVVSAIDGTVHAWEQGHRCKSSKDAPGSGAKDGRRSPPRA
jgi:hypothetical protein